MVAINPDSCVQVLLMSNARLLLDQSAAPALTWVKQHNPWIHSDIASFLRFEGFSAGTFLSVTNPWGTVDISGEEDACLKFQNRHVDPTTWMCLNYEFLTSL
jgi:hypothetical protein